MSITLGKARTAEEFSSVSIAGFEALDVDIALDLFHDDAIMVDAGGAVHRGKSAIALELAKFFSLGLAMRTVQRNLFVSGDIASIISDWSMEGSAPDGTKVKLAGTASDVIRRGEDGVWRYIIDNPFGTLQRNPA